MNQMSDEQVGKISRLIAEEQKKKEEARKNSALNTAIVTAQTKHNLPKALENVVLPKVSPFVEEPVVTPVEPFIKDDRTVAELAKIVRGQAKQE